MNDPHIPSPEQESMEMQFHLADLKRGIAADYDSMNAKLREGFRILFRLLGRDGRNSIHLDPPHDMYDLWNWNVFFASHVRIVRHFEADTGSWEEQIIVRNGEGLEYEVEEFSVSDRMELLFVLDEALHASDPDTP